MNIITTHYVHVKKMHYNDWMNIYPTDARSVCAYYVHDKHWKSGQKSFSTFSNQFSHGILSIIWIWCWDTCLNSILHALLTVHQSHRSMWIINKMNKLCAMEWDTDRKEERKEGRWTWQNRKVSFSTVKHIRFDNEFAMYLSCRQVFNEKMDARTQRTAVRLFGCLKGKIPHNYTRKCQSMHGMPKCQHLLIRLTIYDVHLYTNTLGRHGQLQILAKVF